MTASFIRIFQKGSTIRFLTSVFFLLPASLFFLSACQQKMAQQPYFRPLEETAFYPDGRSARPLEAGTVYRTQRADDDPLTSGLTPAGRKAKPVSNPGVTAAQVLAGAPNDPKNFVDVFPFKMTEKDLHRGMERFTIFCTPCHGALGDGNGKIVERGYLKPTSYHGENSRGFGRYRVELSLRDAPVGYFFEVITKGYGGMPDHSAQVPPADRWRIIAYIRALQLSQATSLNDLPADQRDAARDAADKQEAAKKQLGEKN